MKEFDVIVIGGGPGGYTAAIRASQLGMNVGLVEAAEMGGTCLNWGCIPTKSLLHAADVLREIRSAETVGISTGPVTVDLEKMVGASRDAAERLSKGVSGLMRKNQVEVITGRASIPEAGLVSVDGEEYLADNIIIATGASAKSLPGLVPDGEVVWSASDAMTPKRQPASLLVVGAGAIGVEFASFYQTLGTEVTLIEVLDQILPQEDAEIARMAQASFEQQGMRILTGAKLSDITTDDKVRCNINGEAAEFDAAICSVGVSGNTDGLGLEALGVELDRSFVVVDGQQRTSVAGIYAIGDVAGPPCLAHKASHEGVIAAEVIAGHHTTPVRTSRVPGCTYSHPQVASIGLSENETGDREVRVGRFPFYANGKAVATHQADGMIKTIFDASTGELLGAHMVGVGVSEMIQGYAVAMQLETTEQDLMETIFPHPTMSESMHEAVLDAYQRTLNL